MKSYVVRKCVICDKGFRIRSFKTNKKNCSPKCAHKYKIQREADPQYREQKKQYAIEYRSIPKNKKKITQRQQDPKMIAKQKLYRDQPEVKRKEQQRRRTPEYRAKRRLYNKRPEVKLKQKEYDARYRNKKKMMKKMKKVNN